MKLTNMKLVNVILLLGIVFLIACNSCTNEKPAVKSKTKQNNYIVILDLSDRMIKDSTQVERDTTLVLGVYKSFLKSIKSHVYINSKDRFSIVPIQEGNHFDWRDYKGNLTVNMSDIIPAKRKQNELERTQNIKYTLSKLYGEKGAIYSKKYDDYTGADIWKYFNEDFKTDLIIDTNFINKILIVTDGYLFVDGKEKEIAESLPEIAGNFKGININVVVAEIVPKDNRDDEWNGLQRQWLKWFNSMGINDVSLLKTSSIQETQSKIELFYKDPVIYGTKVDTNSIGQRKSLPSSKKAVSHKKLKTEIVENKKIATINPELNKRPSDVDLLCTQSMKMEKRLDRISLFANSAYPKLNSLEKQKGFSVYIKAVITDLKTQILRENLKIGNKYCSEYKNELSKYE